MLLVFVQSFFHRGPRKKCGFPLNPRETPAWVSFMKHSRLTTEVVNAADMDEGSRMKGFGGEPAARLRPVRSMSGKQMVASRGAAIDKWFVCLAITH